MASRENLRLINAVSYEDKLLKAIPDTIDVAVIGGNNVTSQLSGRNIVGNKISYTIANTQAVQGNGSDNLFAELDITQEIDNSPFPNDPPYTLKFRENVIKAAEAFADNPVKAITISNTEGVQPFLSGDSGLSDRLPSTFTFEFLTCLNSDLDSLDVILERGAIQITVADIKPAIDQIVSAGFSHSENDLYHIQLIRDGLGSTLCRVNALYETTIAKDIPITGDFRLLKSESFRFSMLRAYSTETVTQVQSAYNAIACGSVISELHEFCVLELHGDNDGLEKVESGDNFENLGFTIGDIVLIDTVQQYNYAKTTALTDPTHAKLVNATANDYIFAEATANQAGVKILDFFTKQSINTNFTNPNNQIIGNYLDGSNNEISSGQKRITEGLKLDNNTKRIDFDFSLNPFDISSGVTMICAFMNPDFPTNKGANINVSIWFRIQELNVASNQLSITWKPRTGSTNNDFIFDNESLAAWFKAEAQSKIYFMASKSNRDNILEESIFNAKPSQTNVFDDTLLNTVSYAAINSRGYQVNAASNIIDNYFIYAMVFSSVLSDEQIRYIHNNSLLNNPVSNFPGLELYVRGEQQFVTGTAIQDISGNSRDGVITFSPGPTDFKLIKSLR